MNQISKAVLQTLKHVWNIANTIGKVAAFAHLLFNVFGVFWVMCLFYPFVNIVCGLVGYDPVNDKSTAAERAATLPIVLAMFHTCFNVCNTALLIWFIPQMERVVCWIIKSKANKDEDDFRLRFIHSGIMKTPELSVFEASKEIHSYAERTHRISLYVHRVSRKHHHLLSSEGHAPYRTYGVYALRMSEFPLKPQTQKVLGSS